MHPTEDSLLAFIHRFKHLVERAAEELPMQDLTPDSGIFILLDCSDPDALEMAKLLLGSQAASATERSTRGQETIVSALLAYEGFLSPNHQRELMAAEVIPPFTRKTPPRIFVMAGGRARIFRVRTKNELN